MTLELEDTAQAAAVSHTATASPRVVAGGVGRELPEGKRLGHFQVVKKLGAGGMGEVYLAKDLALDRDVALKVLPGGGGSETARERMVREARAQARVQHPNVAHIYFIGEDEGRLYFAMELVSGHTLAQLVEDKPMPADDALAVIHDAVLGLREAQRSGFTHRDVKPSNLMVDSHGVVKVLDFGIAAGEARAGGEGDDGGAAPMAVTQTSLAGTPLYMAPEQARGEPIDFRADIYALGATLFQLVTGRPPFVAETLDELRTLHENAPRPQLPRGATPRATSSALRALIARMMAPRPEDRFSSYDELLRAIENTSSHYTRPAGFTVRAIATLLDAFFALVLVVGLVSMGTNDEIAGVIRFPVLALVQMLTIRRYGMTPGSALFEIETVAVDGPGRVGWAALVRRMLGMYGVLIALDVASQVGGWFGASKLAIEIIDAILVIDVVLIAVHLLYTSATTKAKRTVWDRWSGTMVRYRTTRRR